MQTLLDLINSFGTQIILAAVGLGIVGVFMGVFAGILGYRHGADVTRTALVGMGLLILIRVIAATLAAKAGVTIPGGPGAGPTPGA